MSTKTDNYSKQLEEQVASLEAKLNVNDTELFQAKEELKKNIEASNASRSYAHTYRTILADLLFALENPDNDKVKELGLQHAQIKFMLQSPFAKSAISAEKVEDVINSIWDHLNNT